VQQQRAEKAAAAAAAAASVPSPSGEPSLCLTMPYSVNMMQL
jgi:hypothetical protein